MNGSAVRADGVHLSETGCVRVDARCFFPSSRLSGSTGTSPTFARLVSAGARFLLPSPHSSGPTGTSSPTFTRLMPTSVLKRFTLLFAKNSSRVSALY